MLYNPKWDEYCFVERDSWLIEIINFMIDTSYKFAINNMDIKIQEGVLLVTARTNLE